MSKEKFAVAAKDAKNYLTSLANLIITAYKGISDSKLVFDLQDQQQKFSKKLKDLLGLHVF